MDAEQAIEHQESGSPSASEKWIARNEERLRALKRPSDEQKAMLLLLDIPAGQRSKQDERKIEALVRFLRAEERAWIAKARATSIVAEEKERERKARTKRLIDLAGLMRLAGLVGTDGNPVEGLDKETILGGLLELQTTLNQSKTDPETLEENKRYTVSDALSRLRRYRNSGQHKLAASSP